MHPLKQKRRIAGVEVASIGLGCMSLSHAYGTPPTSEDGVRLLHEAVDLGVTHFDSAALYGFGRNEELLGKALKPYRQRIHLASKCGMTGVDGKRVIDGRPQTLQRTLEDSLRRLQTEVIDLYYLHRWDKSVPIEDSVGALADMVRAGKVRAIGLSEVSAKTLRRAHAVHPIAAVQTEYSLWTRNAEVAVLDACRELKAAFVAFSPLARGFLSGAVRDTSAFVEKDIRRNMPRFQEPHFSANLKLLDPFRELAAEIGCSMTQLALAWLLWRGEHIIPIPGTTSAAHLREDIAAADVTLTAVQVQRLEAMINVGTVSGPRYPQATQKEIDTEELGVH